MFINKNGLCVNLVVFYLKKGLLLCRFLQTFNAKLLNFDFSIKIMFSRCDDFVFWLIKKEL